MRAAARPPSRCGDMRARGAVPVDEGDAKVKRNMRAPLMIAMLAGLAACGAESRAPTELYDKEDASNATRTEQRSKIGDLLNYNDIVGGSNGGSILVNKHIWTAALDTLKFMPLASTDPFSGVIATDWSANPDAPGERIKVAAFVNGLDMEARSLQVAVYREVKGASGEWIPAPVADATPRRLEDLILTRARQLRVEELKRGDGEG